MTEQAPAWQLANFVVSSTGEGRQISVTGKGHLMDFQAVNDDSISSVYLQLYDRTDIPPAGARPRRAWEVPPISGLDGIFPAGRPFKTGCLLVWSSTKSTYTAAVVSASGRIGSIEGTFICKEGE